MEVGGVLVTGASTGIGAATVKALAAAGFRVFGTVRRTRDSAAIESAGGTPLIMDVTYLPGIIRARDAVERELQGAPLRAIVNNAGVPAVGAIELLELEAIRHVFEVNVLGAIAVTQAFLPMIRAARGRIVNISSVSARLALPFAGPYAGSKFALEGISDSLRRELAGTGVRVVVIQPGSVRTPIWSKIASADLERYQGTPYEPVIRRLRELALKSGERGLPPQDVARAVLRAITASRPPSRIMVVGKGRTTQRLVRFLPDWLLDWMVKRQLGSAR